MRLFGSKAVWGGEVGLPSCPGAAAWPFQKPEGDQDVCVCVWGRMCRGSKGGPGFGG